MGRDGGHLVDFGGLLRRHRMAAGLTQDELAERANVSSRSIGDIERGVSRAPQRNTVGLLAEALGLTGDERAAFEVTARRPAVPPSAPPPASTFVDAAVTPHPPGPPVPPVGAQNSGRTSALAGRHNAWAMLEFLALLLAARRAPRPSRPRRR
jgi:transcriptional regulator with XRE-family HTH domain